MNSSLINFCILNFDLVNYSSGCNLIFFVVTGFKNYIYETHSSFQQPCHHPTHYQKLLVIPSFALMLTVNYTAFMATLY